MNRKKTLTTLNDAPVAIASDGSVIFNSTHLFPKFDNLGTFVQGLVDAGNEVFVGVVVPRRLHEEVLDDIDAALADTVSRLGVELQRRPRHPSS